MKKHIIAAMLPGLLSLSLPLSSSADSGAGCGLGQQIWAGQSGLAAHVLAATTNGTSVNQWFGISFDSLGCNANGVVATAYQRNIYVAGNLDNIARDAARGGGDHLRSLAQLMKIAEQDQPAFFAVAQARYDSLFSDSQVDAQEWIASLNEALLTEPSLAKYVTQ